MSRRPVSGKPSSLESVAVDLSVIISVSFVDLSPYAVLGIGIGGDGLTADLGTTQS